MYVVNNIRLGIDVPARQAVELAAACSGLPAGQGFVFRRAVDARRAVPVFVYAVGFEVEQCASAPDGAVWHEKYTLPPPTGQTVLTRPPVIAGFGPAGMLCAYALAKRGFNPVVLERGGNVDKRNAAVRRFFETGELDENCNVQFGEGGAGTYSDGKLTTRIGDPRCRFVLERLVEFGAPEEILVLAKPHIGTDLLGGIVRRLRDEVERLGGRVMFDTPLTDIEYAGSRMTGVRAGGERLETQCLVLATGHSARDIYALAAREGLSLAAKPFSVGVRIEHLQKDIDAAMYGDFAGHEKLGAAEYAFSHREDGRGVYTFCMCPGGTVVAAASEAGGVVVNGMSGSGRDGMNGNSALCVSVLPGDLGAGAFAGLEFQRQLESAAFHAVGGYRAPVQSVGDFLAGQAGECRGRIVPTYTAGTGACDLNEILPDFVRTYLRLGLKTFAGQKRFFGDSDAVLTGVETRTSSPVRILRGEDLTAHGLAGLYPCGEGAGYAGGIMSAAVDGLAVAERILAQYRVR